MLINTALLSVADCCFQTHLCVCQYYQYACVKTREQYAPPLCFSGWQPGQGGTPQEWQNAAEPPVIDDPNAQQGALPQMTDLPTFQGYGQMTENCTFT